MSQLLKRTSAVFLGLLVFSFGCYMNIQANIGLEPWIAFGVGVSDVTGISFGDVSVITSIVILVIDLLLKEKIGIGTILDAILVGKFIDLFIWMNLMPMMNNFAHGIAVLLLGQVVLCVGSYYYIKPGLGCGPRDTLMIAIGKRFPRMPIGVARVLIEGTALLIGWLCGAKVGLGTVISVFGIGFILEFTFRLLRFNVKAVTHEDVIASVKRIVKKEKAESI